MLRHLLVLALIVGSAHGQPLIGPLNQFTGLATGQWQDLAAFGAPSLGISNSLLQTLAQVAKQVFAMGIDAAASYFGGGSALRALPAAGIGAAAGFSASVAVGTAKGSLPPLPPPLPPLPKDNRLSPWATKHDIFLHLLTDKWTGALVRAQFSPGLQGFLGLLNLQDEQEALIKWLCIIYPWDALVPDMLRDLRDSYCRQALPAGPVPFVGVWPTQAAAALGPGLPGPGILGQ